MNMNETVEMIKDPRYFIFKSSGFYFIFCALIALPVTIVLAVFHNMFSDKMHYVLGSTIPYGLMVLLLVAFLYGYKMWHIMGFKLPNMLAVFLMIPLMIFSYPMIMFVSVFSEFIAPMSSLNISDETLSLLISLGPVVGWLLMAVIPGIVEELICRGFIYGIFRNRGFVNALFVSTICFALLHLNLQQTLYALVFGVLIGIVREMTKSVWPGVFAHILFNSVAVVNIYFGDKIYPPTGEVGTMTSVDATTISTFSEFWSIYSPLFLLAIGFGIVAFFILKLIQKVMHFKFDMTVNKEAPVITGTYVIGWMICIVLGILVS